MEKLEERKLRNKKLIKYIHSKISVEEFKHWQKLESLKRPLTINESDFMLRIMIKSELIKTVPTKKYEEFRK